MGASFIQGDMVWAGNMLIQLGLGNLHMSEVVYNYSLSSLKLSQCGASQCIQPSTLVAKGNVEICTCRDHNE